MQRVRFRFGVALTYGLVSVLALASSGCAAVLIGGAVAGGAAAGYAYYQGSAHQDFPAAFHETWAATSSALQDLGMPVLSHNLDKGGGEIQSRSPTGEAVTITVEPVVHASGAPTQVRIRVGVFGNHDLSRQIHAQIANRLHNPSAAPGIPANAAPSAVPPAQPLPGTAVPVVTAPTETAPPPLAGTAEHVAPVSGPTQAGAPLPWKSSGK